MTTVTITSESQLPSIIYTSGMTILIGASFTITNILNFITIGSSNVTINGQFNTITISALNWPGLVQNGTGVSISPYTNITIKNLIINSSSTLAINAGWICQLGFCNGQILFCSSNGLITSNSGGILGQECYACAATNCFSTGQIGTYAGGIFGSYSVNCNTTQCYSFGSIGNYAGGIFGFGNNYIYNGVLYSPSDILDQSGSQLHNLLYANNYVDVPSYSVAIACYSVGSIGQYGGGIFGYFAYMSRACNCYSLGNGSTLSGGIFAPNYYLSSPTPVYYPSTTLCSTAYCYTIGIALSGNGIFAQTGLTNTESYSKAELSGIWRDCNAKYYLQSVGCIWIDIDKCSSHIPYLLKSFNRNLYTCPYQKIKCKHATSSAGKFAPSYQILRVNGHKKPCNISINETTGVMSFNKVKKATYKIKIINGLKTNVYNTCISNYYVWTGYNISNFILKSKYKNCKKKKSCKSKSSSSSSCSSSSSSSCSSSSSSSRSCSSSSSSSRSCSSSSSSSRSCYKSKSKSKCKSKCHR
jgi:hypothetical protein